MSDIGDVDAWVGVCIPAFRVIHQAARVRATRWLARTKLDYNRNFDLRTHVWFSPKLGKDLVTFDARRSDSR
jgi:hypothetical protein